MSRTKELIEEKEALFNLAQDILKEIGAISECLYHSGIYIDNYMDNDEMYAKATSLYKKDYQPTKEEIKKFQSILQDVINNSSEECYLCKKDEEA